MTAEAASSDKNASSDRPCSDLKIAIFEKAPLKKALYSSLMKRLVVGLGIDGSEAAPPVCLLEVKLANDVFTVTLVLLSSPVAANAEQCEKVLLLAMKESLQHCLNGNIKVKLAMDKWLNPNAVAGGNDT